MLLDRYSRATVVQGVIALFATLTIGAMVAGQCVTSAPNSAPVAEDGWGQAVAIAADGTTAIVGAPYYDHDGRSQSAGAVRMLVNNGGTWEQQGFFSGGAFNANANMGWAVDISADGNTAVAGRPGASWSWSFDGAVRVFVRNTATGVWSVQANLADPTPNTSGRFGYSVSISDNGNTILVGQPGFPTGGNVAGAYAYTRIGSTWSAGVSLPALPAPGEMDEYGYSVALSPDGLIAAVGAPGRTNSAMSHGAVHIYRKNAGVWTQQQVLTRTVAYLGQSNIPERFGHALSLYASGGDATLAIGDPKNSEILLPSTSGCPSAPPGFCMVRHAGCVYLYNSIGGGAWTMSEQIHAPEVEFPENLPLFGPDLDDLFGSSVALRGAHLVIGAIGDEDCDGEDEYNSNGSVYRFSGGQMLQKITHPQHFTNDSFGTSVDVTDDGALYIAGAPRGDSPGVNYTGTVDIANSNISYPMIGVEPTQSAFEVTIAFPNNDPPPQTFTIHLTGRLNGLLSTDCNGEPTGLAVQDYNGLHTVEEEITVALPRRQSVTFGQADINTVIAGHAALLDPQGDGLLRGYTLGATLPLLSGPALAAGDCPLACVESPFTEICVCTPLQAILDICLAFFRQSPLAGGSQNLTVTGLDITSVMNLGMGANNPTIHITGGINVPLPCPADIDGNDAVDTDDLLAMLGTWGACSDCAPGECAGDIAPPASNGDPAGNCAVDTDDLLLMLGGWGACP